MKVSVTLHRGEPPEWGNQRDKEARYGGFNRAYAVLRVDPASGAAACEAKVKFPAVQSDPEIVTHFSLGVCVAPEGYGGAIILAGPLHAPLEMTPGMEPELSFACAVRRERLEALGLIQCVNGRWQETDEHELRTRPVRVN